MALLCGGRLSFAGESPGGRVGTLVNVLVKEGALVGRGAIRVHILSAPRSCSVVGASAVSILNSLSSL